MQGTHLAVALALASLAFAGCLESQKTDQITKDPLGTVQTLLLAGAPLWNDPQNTPHPLFGWPTLSSPANGTPPNPYWNPIPAVALPKLPSGLKHVAKAADVQSGAGIALFGSLAIVPGFTADTKIVDLSDPTKPSVLSTIKGPHRGAATIAYPDGRLVAAFSTDAGFQVYNITDPKMPEELATMRLKQGGHKLGIIPGTPILYNAASCGGASNCLPGPGQTVQTANGVTEIYDLTVPDKPKHVKDWSNGFSCHHVYFWNDVAAKKFRGLCAGIEYTQIWDTTNPIDPKVIVNVPVHHGVADTPSGSIFLEAFSHYAGLSNDGKILVVGDENGGGAVPPGCVASVNTPQGAASTPVGALWFYDVSNEKSPRLLGWYSPLNDPRVKAGPITSCTAHHGRMVPVEGRNVLAMSFYGAGVVVVDFTGIGSANAPLPKVLGQFAQGSDTWETWYNQGYLVTGDLERGLDVIQFT